MPLTLSPLSEADIPAFAAVDDVAMKDWPFAVAMGLNSRVPRIQMVEGWVRHGFETDSAQVYLQVSDDETAEMVAGALWRFEDGEAREKQDENVADQKEGGGDGVKMEEGEDEQAAKMAAAFAEARKSMWKEFEAEFFLGQPYANLMILVTTPAHRRRGAASLLIEWGTQRADERGLRCVLMASEAGLGAYLKHGFKVVREVEMDLRPYGVGATELRRWMVREPVVR
ncbi:hypothetical protein Q7P36_002988 [Cladosporium allicinum]